METGTLRAWVCFWIRSRKAGPGCGWGEWRTGQASRGAGAAREGREAEVTHSPHVCSQPQPCAGSRRSGVDTPSSCAHIAGIPLTRANKNQVKTNKQVGATTTSPYKVRFLSRHYPQQRCCLCTGLGKARALGGLILSKYCLGKTHSPEKASVGATLGC